MFLLKESENRAKNNVPHVEEDGTRTRNRMIFYAVRLFTSILFTADGRLLNNTNSATSPCLPTISSQTSRQVNKVTYHVSFDGNPHIKSQDNTETLIHAQLWNILQCHRLCDGPPNCMSYHTLDIYDHHEF